MVGRFRPGRSRAGGWEGGGGAGEDSRARNRSIVAGGGRSTEGGDGGASGRAALISGRGGNVEGGDDDRAHIQLNIWALLWRTVRRSLADHPRFFLGVTILPLKEISSRDLKERKRAGNGLLGTIHDYWELASISYTLTQAPY